MIRDIQTEAEARMKKAVEALHAELGKLRTGRAHIGLVEHVRVDYYGSMMPLSQVANISVPDARTLSIQPWEKKMVQAIEKAIMEADLGLNPATNGDVIRLPRPALREERRKELVKVLRQEGAKPRVSVRNVRRDANTDIKELLKEKTITEDDERRAEETIQKLTDKYVAEVDQVLEAREKDIMTV